MLDLDTTKDKTATQTQNLKAALDAAANGLKIFPVRVTRKKGEPHKKAASILVKSWTVEASTDATQIRAWWDRYP